MPLCLYLTHTRLAGARRWPKSYVGLEEERSSNDDRNRERWEAVPNSLSEHFIANYNKKQVRVHEVRSLKSIVLRYV